MEKSSARTQKYRPGYSRQRGSRGSFRLQMADYVRAQLLQSLRERAHISQEKAAAEVGVSTKTMRTWEKGGKIRWENAKRLGAFYTISPESLVSREKDATPDLAAPSESQLDVIEDKLDWLIDLLERLVGADAAGCNASSASIMTANSASAVAA
jgi:DNA-binding XRE family transcriptional regulator